MGSSDDAMADVCTEGRTVAAERSPARTLSVGGFPSARYLELGRVCVNIYKMILGVRVGRTHNDDPGSGVCIYSKWGKNR